MSASGPKRTCAGAAATLLVVGHAQQPGGIKRALMSAQETDPEGKGWPWVQLTTVRDMEGCEIAESNSSV